MVSSFAINQLKADSMVDMDLVDSLYVYCGVVEPCVVGDSQVPLPAEGEHGQLVTRFYENVHYIRRRRESFQTIKINIRDRAGNVVPFEQGTLKVTLHFRQHKRLSTLWPWKAEACPCIAGHPIRGDIWTRRLDEKHSPTGNSPPQTWRATGATYMHFCGGQRDYES